MHDKNCDATGLKNAAAICAALRGRGAAFVTAREAPSGRDCPHCGGGVNQWGHTEICPVQTCGPNHYAKAGHAFTGEAKRFDDDSGCDCDRFEGGEHTQLCASVAATRRRTGSKPSKACDVCHGHRKVQHDGDDHECPECAGTGTEDPAWRARRIEETRRETIEACAVVCEAQHPDSDRWDCARALRATTRRPTGRSRR